MSYAFSTFCRDRGHIKLTYVEYVESCFSIIVSSSKNSFVSCVDDRVDCFPGMITNASIIDSIIKISLRYNQSFSKREFSNNRRNIIKRVIKQQRLPRHETKNEVGRASRCPLIFWQKTRRYRLTSHQCVSVYTRRLTRLFPRLTVRVSCTDFLRGIPNTHTVSQTNKSFLCPPFPLRVSISHISRSYRICDRYQRSLSLHRLSELSHLLTLRITSPVNEMFM